MKRIISTALAIIFTTVMTVSSLISIGAAERIIGRNGDVNQDESVDIIDVVLMRAFIVGNGTIDGDRFILADVNSDGNVDIIDIVKIRSAIVNGTDLGNSVTEETEKIEISVAASNDNYGEVTGGGSYDLGESVTVTAKANSGYEFVSWKVGNKEISDSESYTFTAGENLLLTADFVVITADTDTESVNNTDTETDIQEGIYLKTSEIYSSYSGVDITGTTATIKEPGVYQLYGELTDGQIIVDVDKTVYPLGEVELSLNGVTLTNSSDSPIYIASIDGECSISVKKGTINTVTDGVSYTNADGKAAAIYSCDDLKIKGKGTLAINGNCDEGIASKNDLKIWNGTVKVTAKGDAIRGKDSVRIGDPDDTDYPNLSVTATSTSEDGIKATNGEDADKGFVRISGGTVSVNSMYDGIKGEQAVEINGGIIDIYTYKGYTCTSVPTTGTSDSAKAIKAVGLYDTSANYLSMGNIDLNGGAITINSTDDGVHCSGTLTVNGANITIQTADDGLHSDSNLFIISGTVEVNNSYEGVEADNITVEGGTVYACSTDDGFNAAGGADSSGTSNPGGWNPGAWKPGGSTSASTNHLISITGGYIIVNAQGDGIDSNGSLSISGGTTVVYGTTSGGNGIFDIGDGGNCTFVYTGGVVLGIGTSDMFVSPTSGSYIKSTALNASANTYVAVKDASGNVLSVVKAPKTAKALLYCNSDVTVSSCTLYKGGTYSGVLDKYGYGTGGELTGATSVSKS